MVGQDQGFKMSRIEERINWAIENIGVFPIWLCYIWLPLERRNDGKWKGESHIADLGLYGFPPSSSYRCQRDLRAWQLSADAPAAWGDLYMTLEEAGRKDEFGPAYQALRKKYKADGAFKRIEDKIAFYDPNEPDLGGPMPFFRIRRTWRYSKAKFLVMALIVPFIKLGFLTASILDLLLLPVRLVFPKSDSKKLKVD